MDDDAEPEPDEQHKPLPKGLLGENTPTGKAKRSKASSVWTFCKRIKSREVPASLALMLQGKTHVCIAPLSGGGVCNTPLKISRKDGAWSSSHAFPHFGSHHPDSVPGREYNIRQTQADSGRTVQQLVFGQVSVTTAKGKAMPKAFKTFVISEKQVALASQANYYIYGRMHVSKRNFEDPVFRQMLQGTSASGCVAHLSRDQLIKTVRAEFEVFKLFYTWCHNECYELAMGNAYGQAIHDAGTLENHVTYQAFGKQFILPEWEGNVVICWGFSKSTGKKDKDVAILAKETHRSHYDIEFSEAMNSAIADRAAKGANKELGVEDEVCGMHDIDKVGQSATGALVRSKDNKPVNPAPALQAHMKNAHNMAKHFSYGHRYEDMWLIADAANVTYSKSKFQLDLNGTRVAAQHNLLHSELRAASAVPPYFASLSSNKETLGWESTAEFWKATSEIEAILNITKTTGTLVQHEKLYTGAYLPLVKVMTLNSLLKPSLAVVDLSRPSTLPKLPRKALPVEELGSLGTEAHSRAIIECQRRFCGSKTETVIKPSPEVELTDRQLLATLLDLRTCGAEHLSPTQYDKAKKVFSDAYVKFATTAHHFHKAKIEKAEREAAAAKAEAEAKRAAAGSGSSSSPSQEPKEAKPSMYSSGVTYGATAHHSSESEEADIFVADELQLEPGDFEALEGVEAEHHRAAAKASLRRWRKLTIDWRAEFPEMAWPPQGQPLDLVVDLMPLDLGKLYRKISKSDTNRKLYGYIPLMAHSSYGQLGALMAESFCERVLRAAGHIMTEGNTLLSHEELEMLAILRMNKKIMIYMREKHPEIVEGALASRSQRLHVDESDE